MTDAVFNILLFCVVVFVGVVGVIGATAVLLSTRMATLLTYARAVHEHTHTIQAVARVQRERWEDETFTESDLPDAAVGEHLIYGNTVTVGPGREYETLKAAVNAVTSRHRSGDAAEPTTTQDDIDGKTADDMAAHHATAVDRLHNIADQIETVMSDPCTPDYMVMYLESHRPWRFRNLADR